MVKLFAIVTLNRPANGEACTSLDSQMDSQGWKRSATGSDGTTVQLPEGTYQAPFDDDVDCLGVAEELKFHIESNVSCKGATVLVVKAKSWGFATPN